MATFLLYWNPYFSSYKMDRFLEEFDFPEGIDVMTADDNWDRSPNDFNWSIVDHEKAHEGDKFVFVKVGYAKPTGIVGIGQFTSDPYVDKDWSGQGRRIYYMDMYWDSVIKPNSDKILKTSDLIAAIPEVHWSRGKAGTEVAPEIAKKIMALWEQHVKSVK